MLFVISDDDGRILQANKVFTDVDRYDQQLKDRGYDYIRVSRDGLPSPDKWMVNKSVTAPLLPIKERPIMPVSISKRAIKAGGSDTAVITGAPKNTAFSVSAAGSIIQSGVLPDGELEIGIPCPITYEVLFMKWPYQEYKFTIEAVA